MVVGVCQKHAPVPVESVVDAVFQALGKAKLTTESPDITVTVAKNNAVLRQATLQQLQQVLVARKYMPSSAANGTFGPVTQAALMKYQAAEHLPQTGVPDAATIVRALVETST
jgi:peptidoglycan hydrolase-like protein with peptidoglycan-binding domain